MKKTIPYLWIGLSLFASASAQENLNQAFQAIAKLQSDQNFASAQQIEAAVTDAKSRETKQRLEDRLIRALSQAETREASIFVCRQLRTIGSERSIGALERRLLDPNIGHAARLALASNDCAEAHAALRRALTKASGEHELALMQTLAKASDHQSIPLMLARLTEGNPSVAQAAARALGHLAGKQAVKALQAKRTSANNALKTSIDAALLHCAEAALANNNLGTAQAIYHRIHTDQQQPLHFRLAALQGLVKSRVPQTSHLLAKALQSKDSALRRQAIQWTINAPGAAPTETLISLLEQGNQDDRPLILKMLKRYPKKSTAKAVQKVVEQSHDPEELREAIHTLGHVGNADQLPLILKHLASSSEELRGAARSSLVRLSGPSVDDVLMRSVSIVLQSVQEQLIPILSARGSQEAIPALVSLARDDDGKIRKAAIKALGNLVDGAELHHLMDLLQSPADGADKGLIETAILSAFREIPRNEARAKPLLAALKDAGNTSKPQLINLLGRTGTKDALAVIRDAIKEGKGEVRDSAVQSLARWPNSDPSEDLLALAQSAETTTHRVVALRGYVAMAPQLKDSSAAFSKAMAIAKRPEDKRLVLSGIAQSPSVETLGLAASYLESGDLAEEAAIACVKISLRLRRNAPKRARSVLNKILTTIQDEAIQASAKEALDRLDG